MKKLTAILSVLMSAGLMAFAAFPTNTSTKTVNIDKMSSDFTDFYFRWRGYEDQRVKFTIANNSGGLSCAGYYASFKATALSSSGSNIVVILKLTNEVSIATSNISFSVAHTNIPWNGEHKGELILVDAGSNLIRTLARGKVAVEESLYQYEDSTYPYPSLTYLTRTTGDGLYEKKGINTAVNGYVLFARTNSTGYITRWEAISGSAGGTVTNISLTGGLLTGGGGGASPTIGLTTDAVRLATKEEVNAGGLTGNVPVAVEQTIDHGNLLGLTDNDHPQYHDAAQLTGTVANARLDTDLQKLAGNDGGSLTNVNAATLNSQAGSYYRNAANITNSPWLTSYYQSLVVGGTNVTVETNRIGTVDTYTVSSSGGGGGVSALSPWTNNVNGAGYSLTNVNNGVFTNLIRGKTLELSGNATIDGGTLTLNKTGQSIIRAKPHTGGSNGSSLFLSDGDIGVASWIELGRNTEVGWGPATGIICVAQQRGVDTLAPFTILASHFYIGNGATTNFDVTSAGAMRIGANMNANGKAITNVNYITVTNYVQVPLGQNVRWVGAGYTNDMMTVSNRFRIYHRKAGAVITNIWILD